MPTVLITGASSGIGAATALHLDALGYDVVAGVHGPDGHELSGASSRLRPVVLDVLHPDSIDRALDDLPALDAVINNAGIGVPGPLEVIAPAELREQLDVNVVGQVAVTQAALPLLREARGRIVFVGSIGGRVVSPFAGPYHASKFAMEAIADAWRAELEPEQVSVILVEPAAISTPIWDKAIARIDELLDRPDARIERYRARLDAFKDTLTSADESGKDPQDVAETIARALAADDPDPRYVVGGAGKVVTALRPLVPDRVADKLAERGIEP